MRDYIAADAPRKMRSMVDCCDDLVARSSLPDDFRSSRPMTAEDLGAVGCPSLLLYGDCSDILDRGFALGDALAHSELRLIEDCTHALMMEAPETVTDLIVPWLADPAHQLPPRTLRSSARA